MNRPPVVSALLVALLVLLAADGRVAAQGSRIAVQPALKEPSIADIGYLGLQRAEKMDAWLPPVDVPRPLPAVLLIHGGGWQVGDKADRRELNIAGVLSANGYAVFSINYLLAKRYRDEQSGSTAYTEIWPQNFDDCRTALRYLRQNADDFGIDPQRIAVMGTSAGAHLAMLLAVAAGQGGESGAMLPVGMAGSDPLYAGQSEAVAAVVNFYGIHDLRRFSPDVTRLLFRGQTAEQTEANLTAASPVSYIGKVAVPPMLVVHGTADETVDISLSRDLVEDLRKAGGAVELIEVPEAGHSFHLQPSQGDLRALVLDFLDRNL